MPSTQTIKQLLFELQSLKPKQLRSKYQQVFGEPTRSPNKVWLIKRITWGIQAQREGDISERAKARAMELAQNSDIRTTIPSQRTLEADAATASSSTQTVNATTRFTVDPRLPMAGSILTRTYKGQTYQVMVQADGFLFNGETYKSLSAIAKLITGTHCNGFAFFKLNKDQSQ